MWRDEALLLDILLAARDAMEFSRGLTRESLGASKLLSTPSFARWESSVKRRARSRANSAMLTRRSRGSRSSGFAIA
jgi:hypothetical protein